MNAPPSNLPTLKVLCRDARHDMLQAFAQLEIQMAQTLGPNPPKIFSQKLQQLAEKKQVDVDLKALAATRNLIAHAHISIAPAAGTQVSVWRMAEGKNSLNARVMLASEVRAWSTDVTREIEKLIKAISS